MDPTARKPSPKTKPARRKRFFELGEYSSKCPGCELRASVEKTHGTRRKLSREEVRDLCEEYGELKVKRAQTAFVWFPRSQSEIDAARRKYDRIQGQMEEIESRVGQDALDDYKEQQALMKRTKELERILNEVNDKSEARDGLIIILTGVLGLGTILNVFLS